MNLLTAVKELNRRICCEQPVQHFCNDCCMYSRYNCPISVVTCFIEDILATDDPKSIIDLYTKGEKK